MNICSLLRVGAAVPRPFCRRRVAGQPAASIFKPAGIPTALLEEVVLTLDEFEAIRLADLDGLYQEPAAAEMGVSRPTFSRITAEARRKLADALVHGKALRIEGGPVHVAGHRCCRRHEGLGGPARLFQRRAGHAANDQERTDQ
jgi:predicted DNA-binding protein (UPF0251 family)